MLVVGIPSKNESATIAAVTAIIDAGLSAACPGQRALIVNADNGSTDGTSAVFRETPTQAEKLAISTPGHSTGKGTNVLAIMEVAQVRGADALCLIDGDLRSAEPHWLKLLLDAAMVRNEPTF